MNRQQRRQIERETKQEIIERNKNREWFKRLPDNKKSYIGYFIEQKVIENDNITAEILDDCFKAAMIETKDLSLLDCNEIIKIANEHMAEVKNILEKDLKGEYLEMIKDAKLRAEIKEEIKIMVKENRKINNLEIIRILEETYDFPKKDFQILIKESREELGKEALKEIEKDIQNDEINSELSDREKEIELSKLPKYATGEIKANLLHEADHGFECPKGAKEKQLSDKLLEAIKPALHKGMKIKSMEVEGTDGRIYLKSSEGVKLGDKVYKDISEVTEEKEAVERRIEAKKEDIRKQIEKLSKELGDIMVNTPKELEKYAEIEMVFQM